MTLKIPVPPTAKGRPRFTKTGHAYTPKDTRDAEELIRVFLRSSLSADDILSGPVFADATFYVKRPKAHYRTGKHSGRLKDDAPRYPTSRPDIDQYIKLMFDACNEIVWLDDSQVVTQSSAKRYCDRDAEPFITLTVYEEE